ncbi:MAG: cytochrome C [Desulfuromusa sp.]|jgi:hypothetical protein|nr:cytochrome C [Desulfuromusa sp.]
MRPKRTIKIFAAGVIHALLLWPGAMTWANNDTQAEPLALQKIMQDQGRYMQHITDNISRENWQLVAKNALLIADHPQPPLTEKMRILRFVGGDAGKYKNYDNKTYQAGQKLRQAAEHQDGPLVVSAFAMLQQSCLACHQDFRKPFQEHFYEKR